jgi:hypothetical protein
MVNELLGKMFSSESDQISVLNLSQSSIPDLLPVPPPLLLESLPLNAFMAWCLGQMKGWGSGKCSALLVHLCKLISCLDLQLHAYMCEIQLTVLHEATSLASLFVSLTSAPHTKPESSLIPFLPSHPHSINHPLLLILFLNVLNL